MKALEDVERVRRVSKGVKETASSGAIVASVVLNGNGNGHASFDEEEESHSHCPGFFADQFEVSGTVGPSM